MKNQELEKQAWLLYTNLLELHRLQFPLGEGLSPYSHRLMDASGRAFHRWVRRQHKLFIYNPGGFAPPPAQPSGALGQGAIYTPAQIESCNFWDGDCNCPVCSY